MMGTRIQMEGLQNKRMNSITGNNELMGTRIQMEGLQYNKMNGIIAGKNDLMDPDIQTEELREQLNDVIAQERLRDESLLQANYANRFQAEAGLLQIPTAPAAKPSWDVEQFYNDLARWQDVDNIPMRTSSQNSPLTLSQFIAAKSRPASAQAERPQPRGNSVAGTPGMLFQGTPVEQLSHKASRVPHTPVTLSQLPVAFHNLLNAGNAQRQRTQVAAPFEEPNPSRETVVEALRHASPEMLVDKVPSAWLKPLLSAAQKSDPLVASSEHLLSLEQTDRNGAFTGEAREAPLENPVDLDGNRLEDLKLSLLRNFSSLYNSSGSHGHADPLSMLHLHPDANLSEEDQVYDFTRTIMNATAAVEEMNEVVSQALFNASNAVKDMNFAVSRQENSATMWRQAVTLQNRVSFKAGMFICGGAAVLVLIIVIVIYTYANNRD